MSGSRTSSAGLEDRQAELLNVPHFHVVFTVLSEIEVIAFQNARPISLRHQPVQGGSGDVAQASPPTQNIWVPPDWFPRRASHVGAESSSTTRLSGLQEISGFMRSRELCGVGDKIAYLVAILAQITRHNFWFGPPVSASPEVCRELENGLA